MNASQPIEQSLAYFQNWAAQFASNIVFRPPVNPTALENFREKSGLILPSDLIQYLQITDGETSTSAGMIGNWRLMPLLEIQAAWGLLGKLAEKGAFSELTPEKSPYIRQAWWSPSWIPIGTNDTGDYFCLDTDPPDPTRFGQVLLYLRNRPQRPLIAGSVRTWFDRIISDLKAGFYTFDTYEGFNNEGFMKSSLEGKHLLDGLEGKLIA